MALTNLPHDQLQSIILQLDQALYNHREWHRLLIRALVCRLQADQHDLLPEAHKECRFGQWIYQYAHKKLLDSPGFVAITQEHERMHQLAKQMLMSAGVGTIISTDSYDKFANSLERLRLEISTLRHELEELVYNRDPLTGAINRLDMLGILRETQELVKRKIYKSCCLAMMDIDNFGKINDAYGHAAGDKTLVTIVHYITDNLRAYDKIFRYGGEEFLMLLQDVDLAEGYELIERIREGIAKLSIDVGNKKIIHATASFGLSLLEVDHPIEQSIDYADKAVYRAKEAGRNSVKVWSENS